LIAALVRTHGLRLCFKIATCSVRRATCTMQHATCNMLHPRLRLPLKLGMSARPHVRVSACLHVRMSACPHVRMSARPRARMPACPHVRMPACPHVRTSARPHVRVSSCPHVRMSACPHSLHLSRLYAATPLLRCRDVTIFLHRLLSAVTYDVWCVARNIKHVF